MHYIAHRDSESGREQTMKTHLNETAKLASEFAEIFGAQKQAFFCGMLHDIGKYSDKFQRRIRGSGERVDHSTAGAQIAAQHRDPIAAACIAGHHGGLPDFGSNIDTSANTSLLGRLKRKVGAELEDFSAYKNEIDTPIPDIRQEIFIDPARGFFFTHMLYSCLVDADWLDTEAFFNDAPRKNAYDTPDVLYDKLQAYVSGWWEANSEINKKRCEILRASIERGEMPSGMFSLTAPTGSGKTVASVAFGLSHLLKNGLRRIVYVIPYISILEQTKEKFEEIFGRHNVIAHYANVDFGDDENDSRRLAAENWDAPIILTTSVQFFESLFANKPSKCRKLHNIANSVLVFDEAQMLPAPYLKPCIWAVSQLVQHYGCSAVLCTATQPSIDFILQRYLQGVSVEEICPDVIGMHEYFKRVEFQNIGKISNDVLAERMNQKEQVLCVVNSRKNARNIFLMLRSEGSFHLTTAMMPEHRRRVLAEIHRRLGCGEPCRVVATSLIEAGVDVDFPAVFRELAGLDSIIQSAGRCNRNNLRPREESIVCIFESDEKPPQIFSQNIAAAKHILRDFEDISAPKAITDYFEFLYYILKGEGALDSKDIMGDIGGGAMNFEEIAKRFNLIENDQITVYIPVGEGEKLIRQFHEKGPSRELMRLMGQYAVNVYTNNYNELYYAGAVERIAEDAAILVNKEFYSDKTGLELEPSAGQAYFS